MGLWGQVVDPRLAVEMGRRGSVPGAAMWMRPTESEPGAQAGGADGAAVGLVGMEGELKLRGSFGGEDSKAAVLGGRRASLG